MSGLIESRFGRGKMMPVVGQPYVKPFDGTTSFSNWLCRTKICVEQKSAEKALDERISEVDEEFRKADIKARNIIVQSVADNVLEMIREKNTAREMIKTLKAIYEREEIASRIDLQKKFRNLVMRDGGSVKDFLMEFDRVLYELKQAGGKMDDDEVIIQLLSAMPNDYRAVVTSIDILFSKDPKSISLEFVKRKLLEEKRRSQCEPTNTERTESGQAFSATFSKSKTHPRFNNGYNGKKFHYDNRVGNASHLVKVKMVVVLVVDKDKHNSSLGEILVVNVTSVAGEDTGAPSVQAES